MYQVQLRESEKCQVAEFPPKIKFLCNVKILSGQNILNFLLFSAPSFSNKSKLGLKVQLKVQNIDLSIIINTYKHRKLIIKGMSTIKYGNFM